MSFLAPFFLWLLPLTAIPLIIHLLNRQNLITVEFSTLRFFKMMEKESIRKVKFLQLILLMLRTIIILFIILMITRPVATGAFSLKKANESSLHTMIFDDSFSMRGNTKLVKSKAQNIMRQIPDKSQLIWININDGVQFNGLKEDMPPLDNLLKYTFHAGIVTDGLYELQQNIEKEYTSIEVYILTDAQTSSLQDLITHSESFLDMHLYILISPIR